MHTVHALRNSSDTNVWPPTARPIRKVGRPGKTPRPVVCVRVKALGRPSR